MTTSLFRDAQHTCPAAQLAALLHLSDAPSFLSPSTAAHEPFEHVNVFCFASMQHVSAGNAHTLSPQGSDAVSPPGVGFAAVLVLPPAPVPLVPLAPDVPLDPDDVPLDPELPAGWVKSVLVAPPHATTNATTLIDTTKKTFIGNQPRSAMTVPRGRPEQAANVRSEK